MADPKTHPTRMEAPSLSSAVHQAIGQRSAEPAAAILNDRGTVTGLGDYGSFSNTQRLIAFMLLWILIGIIMVIVIVSLAYTTQCVVAKSPCTQAKDALDLLNKSLSPIFTAMIGLVGSVVGFYFGSKQTS